MDQEIRNKLRNVVTQCRKLLEESISQDLEGKYGIFPVAEWMTLFGLHVKDAALDGIFDRAAILSKYGLGP